MPYILIPRVIRNDAIILDSLSHHIHFKYFKEILNYFKEKVKIYYQTFLILYYN